MAEDHAGQRLDLEVEDGRSLALGEVAHLGLGEADVVQVTLGDPRQRAFDILLAKAEGIRFVPVEFQRELTDGRVAAGFDVRENLLDRVLHAGIFLCLRCAASTGLQMPDHGLTPSTRASAVYARNLNLHICTSIEYTYMKIARMYTGRPRAGGTPDGARTGRTAWISI